MKNQRKQRFYNNSFALAAALGLMGASSLQAQSLEKNVPVGPGVYEAVISASDPHIYVSAAGDRGKNNGGIYKFRLDDLTAVDTIALGAHPPFGLAINNKTNTIYSSNTRTGTVSAIDIQSGKVLATISNGAEKSHTRELLVDEANNIIYVSDVGKPSNIWVIDGKTNTYLHAIPETGENTAGMCFAGSTDQIYVTNIASNTIGVIDVKSKEVVRSFPSGGEAPINITSDGERLFVTNQGSGTLTVLDKQGKLIQSIETGDGAIGIAYDPIKQRLYSANRKTGTTTVLDANTYAVLADISTGTYPNHVKVDPNTGTAYVINKAKRIEVKEGEAPVADSNGDTLSKIK